MTGYPTNQPTDGWSNQATDRQWNDQPTDLLIKEKPQSGSNVLRFGIEMMSLTVNNTNDNNSNGNLSTSQLHLLHIVDLRIKNFKTNST